MMTRVEKEQNIKTVKEILNVANELYIIGKINTEKYYEIFDFCKEEMTKIIKEN